MCFAEKSRKIYLNLEINTIFIFVSLFRHNYHPHASGTLFFSENQALEVFNRLLKEFHRRNWEEKKVMGLKRELTLGKFTKILDDFEKLVLPISNTSLGL